jgi:hypothetical protein
MIDQSSGAGAQSFCAGGGDDDYFKYFDDY